MYPVIQVLLTFITNLVRDRQKTGLIRSQTHIGTEKQAQRTRPRPAIKIFIPKSNTFA